MVYKLQLPKECVEFIKQKAKEGMKFTQIERECKKHNWNPTYAQVLYHAGKVYTPKQKQTIQLNFIESTTTLCQEMTTWVRGLKTEYDGLNPDTLADRLMDLRENSPQLLVGENADKILREEYKVRMKILEMQRGEKRSLRFALNQAFQNFVDLLKTPAIQSTQVNILQQQLQESLKDVLNEHTTAPIKIPD